MDNWVIGIPDSTACGNHTDAVGSVGAPKTSFPVVAGMSSKTFSQEVADPINVPPHRISDVGWYAPMITARLLSPPE